MDGVDGVQAEVICQYHVGEIVTSLRKGCLPGGTESLIYWCVALSVCGLVIAIACFAWGVGAYLGASACGVACGSPPPVVCPCCFLPVPVCALCAGTPAFPCAWFDMGCAALCLVPSGL